MGMLSGMQYVNIRHELPQIGIRQNQPLAQRNGYVPAELHHNYEPPAAEVYVSQVKVDIDTYPCRKAYGFLNNTDFAAKYGQEGWQNIASHTSQLTQEAWNMAKNGARPGQHVLSSQAKSHLASQITKWPQWVAKDIPDPVFTVTPAQVEGQMNPGSDTYDIQTTDHADIAIRTGTAETYVAKEGSLRMWTTEGHYDIYA